MSLCSDELHALHPAPELPQRQKASPLNLGMCAICAGGAMADILVRKRSSDCPRLEVRVAVIGNVDSGKSTLVGVLTRGLPDDGRGLARSKVD